MLLKGSGQWLHPSYGQIAYAVVLGASTRWLVFYLLGACLGYSLPPLSWADSDCVRVSIILLDENKLLQCHLGILALFAVSDFYNATWACFVVAGFCLSGYRYDAVAL